MKLGSRAMRIQNRQEDVPLLLNPRNPVELRNLLVSKNVKEIELNEEYGFTFTDLAFIEDLSFNTLTVLSTMLKDDSAVMTTQCKELSLLTKCHNAIDYTRVGELSSLTVWRWRFDHSIFNVCRLSSLGLEAPKTIDGIKQLASLVELGITEGSAELRLGEIGQLTTLRYLQLGYCRSLNTISWIRDLGHLESLEITWAQGPLALPEGPWLDKLRTLHLNECGPIESLRPLMNAGLLKEIWFWGQTNILDGRIRFLLDRGVRILGFRDRRHYDVCQKDLDV